jgi:hypothetical protein
MHGDPELHDDGSMAVDASDPAGARYEVRVREMEFQSHPQGLTGRLLSRLLSPPQLSPGEQRYMAAAMPLDGDLRQQAGVTVINAHSINEALTVAVQTLERGSFPASGEPTPL